ncbi:MAG: hypothetical protein IJ087_08865 [Eggerthellaceae bacterium]|nr:hypothetical protein [Eggerthellaceae bacterium]
MMRHTSASRAVRETARCSLALFLGALLLFATFGTFAPRTAGAANQPMWQLQGVRIFTHAPDNPHVTYSYTENGVSSHWDNKTYNEKTKRSYGCSFDEQRAWGDLPERIVVGQEPDVYISFEDSYSGFSGNLEGTGSCAPLYWGGNVRMELGVYDPNEKTIDDLFDYYGERYASAGVPGFEFLDFWEFGMVNVAALCEASDVEFVEFNPPDLDGYPGARSREWKEALFERYPSGSRTYKWHVTEGFSRILLQYGGDYGRSAEAFLEECCDEDHNPVAIDDPMIGMAIRITAHPIDDSGDVTVVYLYTWDPDSSGTSGGYTQTPKENVTVETTPPKEGGEFGVWVIPAAIIGGAAVIGGAVALSRRGRKGGDDGPGDDEPDDDPDEPSTFRMALYKEFGDTLFVGGGPQTVGALIEEVKPDGQVRVRDDLTAHISFGASTNLSAQDIGMQNHYRCVNVEALNADSPEAIVSITFTGEGGTFTNNVKFKVGKTELYFGDVALTFIAGYKQTLAIPFCFAGMQLPEGVEPVFKCTLWTGNVPGEGSNYFTDVKVVRDREHPEAMWNVRLTETGIAPVLGPGELEHFTCEVTATWKAPSGESKLTGIFDLYRFVEGIRLHVEPLKCYAVDRKAKFVEFRGRDEGETPAEFREKLDAWRAQLPEDSAKGEYVIPVECEGVTQQAARSIIRATLYTWGAGYDGDIGNPGWGQAFDEMPLLDPDDPDAADIVVRAVNPLPEFGKTKIEFADVPGSSVLKDADGNDVVHPCEAMGFGYFLKKIDYKNNEQTFHVVASKGILTPPNRVQVDVTVKMEWSRRKFERTERVMAISQPWRADYAEKAAAYDADDAHKLERLAYIQNQSLRSDTTTWNIKGGLSLVETMGAITDALDNSSVRDAKEAVFKSVNDAVDEEFKETGKTLKASSEIARAATGGAVSLTDAATGLNEVARSATRGVTKVAEKAVELNPLYHYVRDVEAAGRVAVNVVGSIPGQLETRYMTYTEYGDMMPLYHYIQMMADGYNEHYGLHEPDYIRVTGAFLRRARGETGPAQAAMEAYFSRELQYCDAVRMTVKDWNESWLLMGLSIGCAIATAGLSDAFFIPFAAIGKGLEGAIDCIDKGGAKDYEIFRSACDAAARQLVFGVATGKIVEYGMKWASFGKGVAESITKEFGAEALFQKGVAGLTGFFSSSKAGQAVGSAAKVLAHELDEAKKAALAAKEAFEQSVESLSGEIVERDISYCLGRIEGKLKLKNIDTVLKSGGKDLTRFERRQLLYAIQCDKHAMRALRADTSELGKAAR